MRKNKKGEIATLLTLGLVIVGAAITLVTSVLTNNQKNIASNPRAAAADVKNCVLTSISTCRNVNLSPCQNTNADCIKCSNLVSGAYKYRCPELNDDSSLALTPAVSTPSKTPTPTKKITPTKSPTPTPGGKNSCCKVFDVNKYECQGTGKSKVLNTGNNYESSCDVNGYDNCSEYPGAPTASGAYVCLSLGGANTPPEGTLGGPCRPKDPKCDGTMVCNSLTKICEFEGGLEYPEDDSCWLVKCELKKPAKLLYTASLSQYDMPLTSCQGGSPYSGGGMMIIGEANAQKEVDRLTCDGNTEITITPTKTPTPKKTSTPTPTPKSGGGGNAGTCEDKGSLTLNCSGGTQKKVNKVWKSNKAECSPEKVEKACYGISSSSCTQTWTEFFNSQCNGEAVGGGSGSCEKMTCPIGKTGTYYRKKGQNTYGDYYYYENITDCTNNKNFTPYQPDMTENPEICKPAATPTLKASSQCTPKECASPHKGVFYSYKCVGLVQNNECPQGDMNFYSGDSCVYLRAEKSVEEMEANYCNSDYVSVYAKRIVNVSYHFSKQGAVSISPDRPTVHFWLYNGQGGGLSPNPKIPDTNINNFPVIGNAKVETGSNSVCYGMEFFDPGNNRKTLTGCSNVVDGNVSLIGSVSNAD